MTTLSTGIALWFTGTPSSGKTTIANELTRILDKISIPNIVFDGDEVRAIIAGDLDYSEEGRLKSLYKYVKLSNIAIRSKILCMVVVNNHSQKQRIFARKAHPPKKYIEVFIDTPIEVCTKRDVKGLYNRAEKGEIENLVGISIPYERPSSPEIKISTMLVSVEEAANKIVNYLVDKHIIVY